MAVKSLPKGALVETQVLLQTVQREPSDEDESHEEYLNEYSNGTIFFLKHPDDSLNISQVNSQVSTVAGRLLISVNLNRLSSQLRARMRMVNIESLPTRTIFLMNTPDVESLARQLKEIPELSKLWKSTVLARLFYAPLAIPDGELNCSCPFL